VPVGPTTVAGYGVTAVGVALALVAFLAGDRSEQTLGVLVAGGVAALAFVVTQVNRYAQARELARRPVNPSPVLGAALSAVAPGELTRLAIRPAAATGAMAPGPSLDELEHDGPRTPDEDESFGPEDDDPRAAAPFDRAYEVPDFDPEHEVRDLHDGEHGARSEGGR